ncbi:hypothetical protein EIP86_006538 [Pleurotus ostreatoroseus]|nr:hypothetical protein EIP86_006538 [Pleurotus ostreatoroseus]
MPAYNISWRLTRDIALLKTLLADVQPVRSPSPDTEERCTEFLLLLQQLRPQIERFLPSDADPDRDPVNDPDADLPSDPESDPEPASDPEPSEPDDDASDTLGANNTLDVAPMKLSSQEKREAAVLKRLHRVLPAFELGPVAPEDVPAILTHLPTGSRPRIEDAAFALLCRGYENTELHHWRTLLSSLGHAPPSLPDIRVELLELDDIAALSNRLFHRHEQLAQLDTANDGLSWILHVLKHVEALKFAMDWNAIRGRGSQTIKSRFYRDVFVNTPDIREVVRHVPEDELETYVNKTLGRQYKTWKRKHIEPTVTARNRFLALYHSVSPRFLSTRSLSLTPCQFGSALIIDPAWNITDLAHQASQHFPYVLEALAMHIPAHPDDGSSVTTRRLLHDRGTRVLLALVRTLGDRDLMEHVQDFLIEHPPSFD